MPEAEGVGDTTTRGRRPVPRQPGMVLEVRGRHATVLADGRFLRMRAMPGWEAGEEVWVSPPSPWSRRARLWRLAAGVSLALATGSGAWAGLAAAQTVALVSVDINPGVQFGVNASGRVVSQQGTDAAGTQLLQSLDLRGRTVQAAVATVVSQALRDGYLRGAAGTSTGVVLLGVAPKGNGSVRPAVQTQVVDARSQAAAVLAQHGVQAAVLVVQASAGEAQKAQAAGVSVGDYYMASAVRAAQPQPAQHKQPAQPAESKQSKQPKLRELPRLRGKSLSQTLRAEGVPTDDVAPVVQAVARKNPKTLQSVLQQAAQGVPPATLEQEVGPPPEARGRSGDNKGHGRGHRLPSAGGGQALGAGGTSQQQGGDPVGLPLLGKTGPGGQAGGGQSQGGTAGEGPGAGQTQGGAPGTAPDAPATHGGQGEQQGSAAPGNGSSRSPGRDAKRGGTQRRSGHDTGGTGAPGQGTGPTSHVPSHAGDAQDQSQRGS